FTFVPPSRRVEALSGGGTIVGWPTPVATDPIDGALPVTCDPASGSFFAIGLHIVSCSAVNSFGVHASVSFYIVVVDSLAPKIVGLPTSSVVEATSVLPGGGAIVTWPTPTAKDIDDGIVPVICTPASGSTFLLGTTIVTCQATDTHGNTGRGRFTVSVRD